MNGHLAGRDAPVIRVVFRDKVDAARPAGSGWRRLLRWLASRGEADDGGPERVRGATLFRLRRGCVGDDVGRLLSEGSLDGSGDICLVAMDGDGDVRTRMRDAMARGDDEALAELASHVSDGVIVLEDDEDGLVGEEPVPGAAGP